MVSILPKPINELDEEVLRQYSKLTKKWEDKGRSRYILSNLFNVPSFVINYSFFSNLFISFLSGWNLSNDNITKPYGKEFNIQEESTRLEQGNPFIKTIDRITRLPLFLTGIGLTCYGAYEAISGFYNNDSQCTSDGLSHLLLGIPFVGVSSSQYIKDSDPKLLNRNSLFQIAYKGLKNKLSTPKVKPVTVPVEARRENYSHRLEDYLTQ